MSNLPPWYINWVPRVSEIVSFIFPFDGNSKKRYQQWLKEVWVDENLYLEKAQTVWTYIHQHLEDYINWEKSERKKELENDTVVKLIENGKKYIDDVRKTYTEKKGWKLVAEPILLDKEKRYQGSSDLVLINEKKKEVVVIDWKSFGISKSFFSLDNKYKKPYDKIKKGRLQFSLYWETFKQKGYTVKDLVLVYLHQDWAFTYSLEQYSSDELNSILKAFAESKKQLTDISVSFPNENNMYEIEIRLPTETYGYINLKSDISKIDNWKTEKENVDELIKKAKYIRKQLKD